MTSISLLFVLLHCSWLHWTVFGVSEKLKICQFIGLLKMLWRISHLLRWKYVRPPQTIHGDLQQRWCQKLPTWHTTLWLLRKSCRWSGSGWMTMARIGGTSISHLFYWTICWRLVVSEWPSSVVKICWPSRRLKISSITKMAKIMGKMFGRNPKL